MSLDFTSFRKLLYQNALEDAISALRNTSGGQYATTADHIASQLNAWQKSRQLNPFGYGRSSRNHRAILHNLYQSGLAASKNGPAPKIKTISPWIPVLSAYVGIILLLTGAWMAVSNQPACPSFDPKKPISIIIDRFLVDDENFLEKLDLVDNVYEKYFRRALGSGSVNAVVHAVNVSSEKAAQEKCDSCHANMVVYGRGNKKSQIVNVDYYLRGENYYNYKLNYGFPDLEYQDNSFFDPRINSWSSDIQCIVHLFSGLIQREEYNKENNASTKATLIRGIDSQFSEAVKCIKQDDSLKVYALHCLAWAKLEQQLKDDAQDLYRQILNIDSTDALALNNSGQLFTQDSNFLYANMRYEALLQENDLPYVRIANAVALKKLDRKEEADREVEHVKGTQEYRMHKEVFDQEIKKVHVAHFQPSDAAVTEVRPSLYLNGIATKFNSGDREGGKRSLDSLYMRFDTSTFTPEDISLVRSFYSNIGEAEKVQHLDAQTEAMQIQVPVQTEAMKKATAKAKQFHH